MGRAEEANERPYFHARVFWSLMITNSNKAETAGSGYNDLFVMQIPLLSSFPKINNPKQMTICGGAHLSEAGSLAADRSFLSLLLRVWINRKWGRWKSKWGEGPNSLTHSMPVVSFSLLSPLQVSGMCGHTPQRASRSVGSPPPQPPAASAARHTQPSPSDSDETLAGLRR